MTTPPRNSAGWDGKLRVEKRAVVQYPPAPGESPPESEDETQGPPVREIDADEGLPLSSVLCLQDVTHRQSTLLIHAAADLLDDVPETETVCPPHLHQPPSLSPLTHLQDIDLNHSRITSLPALRLSRFQHLTRLCLRQNGLLEISLPPAPWGAALSELDLYDNMISHIRGLDALPSLTSLDLSFNKIKHIKNLSHLTTLTDLYFVQNKISRIEGLDTLTSLTNLELAANRIREIENLDTLTNLTQLWLGKNKLTHLANLAPLQNLTLLSLQSNRLTSPSLSHLATLPKLTDLYLSHNALDSIAPLAAVTTLRVLDISSNPLASLRGVENNAEIEEVWASNCQIDGFADVEAALRDKAGLTTIYLEGNPLETRQRALYRNKVRLALPQVKQIDASKLSSVWIGDGVAVC